MSHSYGIDTSNNNGGVDITRLSPLPGFVLAKASEGTNFEDQDYGHYAAMAEDIGAHFGAYHFFHAEKLNARAQAEFFCKCANPRSMLSLWLDYEIYGVNGATDAQEIGFFISYVKVLFPLAKVGIYCNETGYTRIVPYLSEIPFNGLWYANPSIPAAQQGPDIFWQIHQFGTANNVDQDYSTWTTSQMQAYWKWQA